MDTALGSTTARSNVRGPPVSGPTVKTNRRALILALVAAFAFLALLAAWVISAAFWIFDRVNSSAEHRCMIAIVETNAQSRSLLGTSIGQRGLTSASFNRHNSDYSVDMSFAVAGSRQGGTAYARGHRSPFE